MGDVPKLLGMHYQQVIYWITMWECCLYESVNLKCSLSDNQSDRQARLTCSPEARVHQLLMRFSNFKKNLELAGISCLRNSTGQLTARSSDTTTTYSSCHLYGKAAQTREITTFQMCSTAHKGEAGSSHSKFKMLHAILKSSIFLKLSETFGLENLPSA